MHRLEHARHAALRIDIGARRDAETARERAAKIGQEIAEEVRADHDIERLRLEHEPGGHGIDEPLLGGYLWIFGRDPAEDLVPERHAVLLGIALGHARYLSLRARHREVECVADDTFAAVRGED